MSDQLNMDRCDWCGGSDGEHHDSCGVAATFEPAVTGLRPGEGPLANTGMFHIDDEPIPIGTLRVTAGDEHDTRHAFHGANTDIEVLVSGRVVCRIPAIEFEVKGVPDKGGTLTIKVLASRAEVAGVG